MNRSRPIGVLLFGLIVTGLISGHVLALTGKEIIEEQKRRDQGYHDESSLGEMILLGPGGKTEARREFEAKKLEEEAGGGDKWRIRILAPPDLKGTTLLSHQNKNGPDDQWLYLPSLNKTRRIAGQGKSGRFLGSELTYEDLMPPDTKKYRYELTGEENCDGGSCFVVASTPLFGDSAYSKTVAWIRKDTYRAVKVHFYDKKARLIKEALFSDFKQLAGKFLRPYRIGITNKLSGRATTLVIKSLKISGGLTPADFSRNALEH